MGTRCRVPGIRYQVQGIRYQVQGIRYRVSGFRYRVQGSGCGMQGAGCRVQGAGCRVQVAGCWLLVAGCRTMLPQRGRMTIEPGNPHPTLTQAGHKGRVQGAGCRVQGTGCRADYQKTAMVTPSVLLFQFLTGIILPLNSATHVSSATVRMGISAPLRKGIAMNSAIGSPVPSPSLRSS